MDTDTTAESQQQQQPPNTPMETDEAMPSNTDEMEANDNNDNPPMEAAASADPTSLTSNNMQPTSEQLEAAGHDNLATLAAVSAAGGEMLANKANNNSQPANDQLPSTSSTETANSASSAGEDTSSQQSTTTAQTQHQSQTPQTQTTNNPPIDEEDAKWHTVGIFSGLSTTVTNYIDNSVWTSSGLDLNSEEIPDLTQFERINLEPGTAYRFRIRAINTVGASDWSEISSFKTCLPGFPGAPSAIKISKSSEGAHLTWEPPPSCVSSNEIVEYSVYLAVKPGKEKEAKAGQKAPAQLAFVRVYVGAANQCTVSHASLSAAHVDCSNKPAIIFRIAARNEKGYGPATQVRWLQDPVQNSNSNANLGSGSLLSPTRVKPEIGGASPSKRFKSSAAGR